ncbi:Histone-lysine N-methyltransferase [Nymphaea thermarum]|nr:Histone-lysine N-methyltransferase [Nymphaea thermarum]
MVVPSGVKKMVVVAVASSTIAPHFGRRKLTTVSASLSSRLVPRPLDLVSWVRREGGFVHQSLRIGSGGHSSTGLDLIASEEISGGSDLIRLPSHLPLSFDPPESARDGSHALLIELASKVPASVEVGCGRCPGKLRISGERSSHHEKKAVGEQEMALFGALAEELWALKLGLRLLQERATVGSFWWPYISNLPEAFSTPIFFSGDEIKNLQYAPIVHQVNKRCRFLLDFEKVVKQTLEDVSFRNHPFRGQDVDASALGWAMAAVSTRAFRLHGKALPHGTESDIPMLLPLIDMCNHSFEPNAEIIQEQDNKSPEAIVKVVSKEQIQRGDSVLLNYGDLCNDLLLLDYGFVIPENPYDTIELRYDGVLLDAASMAAGLQSPNFSSPTQWQDDLLRLLNLEGDGADLKVTLGGPGVVDGRLLAAIRILLGNDKDVVEKHNLSTLQLLSTKAPLGLSNEIFTLRTLIALCVIALGHFPTKIMEDESLLKGTMSSSMKLAIQLRLRKKTLISDVMRELTRKVNTFSNEKGANSA